MPADELNETLIFEIPCRVRADALCERLRPRWHCDAYDCTDIVLVAAELRPRADDLGVLLRAVRLWASDSQLALLRFHLDGRSYVMESGAGVAQPEPDATDATLTA
jgi:hypothetical protein